MKVKKLTAVLSAASLFASMLTPITVSHAETTDLYVGADKEYTTIMAAVEAAKTINPQSEDDRVTINVAPGNYEEQVLIEGLNYVTLQQAPDTEGKVNLYWHYCTGYTAGDCGLDGRYDPKINWSDSRTWTGYNEGDEQFTAYKLGQKIGKGTKISYYDTDGVAHKDVAMQKDYLGAYTDQAALFINDKSTNITVKDFNIVNAIPVMVTEGEKAVGVAPEEDRDANHATSYVLPNRYNLTVCDENTPMEATDRVKAALAISNDVQKVKALEALTDLTAGESAYLVRSDKYNERGHAISANGDKITFENVRARGNQDSVYISTGRLYFKNCDLIGGTDYIYGNATAVFDSCKLGAEGMSNRSYGATITAANHDAKNPYGYLFYNCELYNVLDNITTSQFGRPWRQDAQITFYKTLFDDTAQTGASAASISASGWSDMSGNEKVKARFYEYGSYTRSGTAVDTSKRHKNENGFGSVLDKWQILEFNPKNYFNNSYWDGKGEWDPMNFADTIADVTAQMDASTINIPAGEETMFNLPVSSDGNIEFHWVSASENAVVSEDEKTISVIRPAAGEDAIETTVTLYARNTETGLGDKKDVPVTIAATTDTENVFNIPVTLNASASLEADNDYTITVTKNGALVKKQVITVAAGELSAQTVLENIPASETGIEYNVKIVSASDEITVKSPESGEMTITGVTGNDVPLNIIAQKLVDDTVELDITAAASGGTKSFNLIDLAKKAGADSSISESDVMTVEYDVAVGAAPSNHSYIDLVSLAPSSSVSTPLASRYALTKVNSSWTQLDMVDCAGVFSGSSNTENQWLNIAGKLDYSTINHVTITINYKTKVVTAAASGGGSYQSYKEYTFGGFPASCTKGNLYLAYYPTAADDVTLSNVKITYKNLVSDAPSYTVSVADSAKEYVQLVKPVTKAPAELTEMFVTASTPTAAGSVYTDDTNLTVTGEFATTISGAAVAIDDKDCTHFMNIRLDGTDPNKGAYTEKAGSTVLHMTAKKTGTLKIYYRRQADSGTTDYTAANGKDIRLCHKSGESYDAAAAGELTVYSYTDDTKAYGFCTQTFTLTAGESYLLWARGTTGSLYGYTFVPEDYEVSAAAVEAAEGEELVSDMTARAGEKVLVKIYEVPGLDVVPFTEPKLDIQYEDIGYRSFIMPESDVTVDCETRTVTAPTEDPDATPKPTAAPTSTPAPTITPGSEISVDFTVMDSVPVYSAESGQGFVSVSGAIMPEAYRRQVAPVSEISVTGEGAKVTESTGSYLKTAADDNNFGGLIYRVDTAPGAYHIEVEVTGSSADTQIAPTGMQASRLTSTNNWDNAGEVPRTVSAKWEGSKWSYDFATGEDFVEIEIEPTAMGTASAPQTVGVKSIKITPIDVKAADDKPTIHILGDSTQKTYTFNETISAWGQTIGNYFNSDKVNVVNYSMGGRAMKSNYNEGRFDEILISGKAGDYVFIHSAHNDETISNERFTRGASTGTDLEANNANQNRWFDMYISAIKARGMIPVLVTAMPRTGSGVYSESASKPNGFNPDSPGNMRKKAAADSGVALAELYEGAKAYIDKLDAKEVMYIYNNIEAGETPANSAANGASGDGTHYREAASKMWSRIILQSIYDQSKAAVDTYTDKAICESLAALMDDEVQAAAASGDWSAVFPEMASDVSAVDVVPGAKKQSESNYYYRNNIEKALQLGLLSKNSANLFMPNEIVTVGEYARGVEKAFGLEANSLTNYTRTYAELAGDNPTAPPTNAPTDAPTEKPEPQIVSAVVTGNTTVVTLKNVDASNIVAAASYENGVMTGLKTASALSAASNEQVITFDGIAADKVFVWNSLEKMQPVCNAAETTEAALSVSAAEYTVTVTQPQGGTVTVYNESAYHTATVDIPSGVTAGQVIADNSYFTLTAPSEIVEKSDANGEGMAAGITKNAIEIRNNGTKQPKYTAKADGVMTAYLMFVDHKTITLRNNTTGESVKKYINNTSVAGTTQANQYAGVEFDVKAGSEYELMTDGGTGRLFGIGYASTDYPQSTESLTVNAGDTVRISAVPNDYYLNKSILVNGSVVSNGKSAVFTVTGDTAVTAEFKAEPVLTENTAVASDAALTREVMAAILYDAYQLVDKESDIYKNMQIYMGQNGNVPSPDDPNYDPNLTYEGSPYIPIVGWGALTDTSGISSTLYQKVKSSYNLGLIRSEQGIARGSKALGNELEPNVKVTRAKAAKSLVFAWILTQKPGSASQKLPDGVNHGAETTEIVLPNTNAPVTPIN